jgi:polysaccharide deacetylase 2 family uncharacterized protein YibQ
MPRDELRQPLRRLSFRQRLWAKRPSPLAAASISAIVLFVAGGLWLSRIPYPFAGEPVVTVAIPPIQDLSTASTAPPAANPDDTAPTPEDIIDENASIAEDPGADTAPQPNYQQEANIIVARNRAMKAAPIDAVTETTPEGPLPRISGRGKKPFDVYSQVTPMAVTTSKRPKIAILLGGMGLNQDLTQKAIDELPGDISFGFAPYGEDLQAQVNKARAKGHEIMLQVPMEPVGYPGISPGPKTLLADAPSADNIAALRWHMSRFAGYAGITNYMGARLLATADAVDPMMRELKDRGLVYLEDATVNLSVSPKIGEARRLPVRHASTIIDADPTPKAIAEALAGLEQEAIANGTAIGTGSGLDVTIDIVAEWAKDLQQKGILLIPISAAYKGRAT